MKYDPTYQYFSTGYNSSESLSESILQELKDVTILTEEIFIKVCRKKFKEHFKKLKNKSKLEFIYLDSDRTGLFRLEGCRKENKKEEKERLKSEEEHNQYLKKSFIERVIAENHILDISTLDEAINILTKKKEELQK